MSTRRPSPAWASLWARFAGIDLDSCFAADGQPLNWARYILDDLNTYAEVSPSGRGIKLFLRGSKPEGPCRRDLPGGHVEVYGGDRFFTVTGNRLPGAAAEVQYRERELHALHATFFPPEERPATPTPPRPVELADADLIAKATGARNGAAFTALCNGDTSAHGGDDSRADLALCSHLAFWTGGDGARIDALFRESGLYREKWERADYREATIAKALEGATDLYSPPRDLDPEDVTMSEDLPLMPVEAQTFALTDTGNAERLIARFGADLRYCPLWKAWLVWDGRRWRRDDGGEVLARTKVTVRSIIKEALDESSDERRAALSKWAGSSESAARRKAMIALALGEDEVRLAPEDLDRDPMRLCLLNGIIDLRTGWRPDHDRAHLITKLAPVTFDPDATCPRWLAFLERIMGGNEGLIRFLQRAVGYSLTGDVSEQCIFLLYGTGANGRSVFVKTVARLLGKYATEAAFETFLARRGEGPRNDVADLCGARFVSALEMEEGQRLAESLVKRLTGGEDTVKARFLYSEHFEFDPTF